MANMSHWSDNKTTGEIRVIYAEKLFLSIIALCVIISFLKLVTSLITIQWEIIFVTIMMSVVLLIVCFWLSLFLEIKK